MNAAQQGQPRLLPGNKSSLEYCELIKGIYYALHKRQKCSPNTQSPNWVSKSCVRMYYVLCCGSVTPTYYYIILCLVPKNTFFISLNFVPNNMHVSHL